MTPVRALVCDDEPLAVRRLASMLATMPGVEVIATTTNGREVLGLVDATAPHLLLLDIEMPDVDGFDVVEELARTRRADTPLVAFVTAYRKFAPQAFETGAIDFLPKPFRMTRLDGTLARARQSIEGREAARRLTELESMLDSLRANHAPSPDAHVWVPRRGEVVRIDLHRVERIVAEGAYVRLHLDGTSYLHREHIGAIHGRLDAALFVRVHRSHVVRIDQVTSIRRTIHGGGELALRDGERVPLGRKYSRDARCRLLTHARPQ